MGNCKKCWDTGKLKLNKSLVSRDGKQRLTGFERESEEVFCSCKTGEKLRVKAKEEEDDQSK